MTVISADTLPTGPGAYVLIIDNARAIALDIGALGAKTLPAGRYAYAGSARGPGGIRARIARHLRADKKPHWHIDRLTECATIVEIQAYPDGRECDLMAQLLTRPGARIPIPGFGSSDCRNCVSHLVALG